MQMNLLHSRIAIFLKMKLTLLLFVSFAVYKSCSVNSVNEYTYGVRFRSVKCFFDNYTVLVKGCFLKAYSRRLVTLNLHGSFGKPLKKPCYFHFILYYRYGNIYREVIDTKKREWCSIMDGTQTHLYIKLLIAQLKDSAPKLFHKCPYEGEHNLYNITVNEEKAFDLFPQGFYKLKVMTHNSTNTLVFQMDLLFEIKSQLKESMG
ncbi:hypothetical protein ACKWTF_015953 [Chironomus riparius]